MAAVLYIQFVFRHLGFLKVRNFNCRHSCDGQFASSCQISFRSVRPLRRYGHFSIFLFKMAAVRHIQFVLSDFGPPTKSIWSLSLWKVWLDTVLYIHIYSPECYKNVKNYRSRYYNNALVLRVYKNIATKSAFMTLCHKVTEVRFFDSCTVLLHDQIDSESSESNKLTVVWYFLFQTNDKGRLAPLTCHEYGTSNINMAQ